MARPKKNKETTKSPNKDLSPPKEDSSPKSDEVSLEAPVSSIEQFERIPATEVFPEEENAVNANTEPSEAIVVSEEDYQSFVDAVNNPPEPSQKLIEAVQEYNQEVDQGLANFNRPEEARVEFTIKKGDLNQLVHEVLHVASLGGDIAPKHLPRMNYHPNWVKMTLPESVYADYKESEYSKTVENEDKYNLFVVSSVDPLAFIKEIIVAGKRGGIVKPGKSKFAGSIYSSHILIKNVLEVGPHVRKMGKQVIYTKDELKELNLFDLRLIGAKYNLTHRQKDVLVGLILDKQEEIQNAE